MLAALLTLGGYAYIVWTLLHVRWLHWAALLGYYLIQRPYLSMGVNRYINIVGSIILLYAFTKSIYNSCYHPLASYKGPLLNSITRLPWTWSTFRGWQPQMMHKLHLKYGPVVRVAPDELSFTDPDALLAIYARRDGNRDSLPKQHMMHLESQSGERHLASASDEDHERMRMQMNAAFSDEATVNQEGIVRQHIDSFIGTLEQQATGAGEKSDGTLINVGDLFSYAIFDIMGDLFLGKNLNTIASNSNRRWCDMIPSLNAARIKASSISTLSTLLTPCLPFLLPHHLQSDARDHRNMSKEHIHGRLEMTSERPDFLTPILKYESAPGRRAMTKSEIEGNCWHLILAGTQPTANLLTAAVSYLMRKPAKLHKLTEEVRGAFSSPTDITFKSTTALSYLDAILHECCRLAPPVAGSSPRLVDEDTVICGHHVPKGTIVGIPQFAIGRSPSHFRYASSFIPERWLPATSDLIVPDAGDPFFTKETFISDRREAMQPFSVGPRNCIGQGLALAEFRLFLALLVYEYAIWGVEGVAPIAWEEQKCWNHFAREAFYVKLERAHDHLGSV